MKRIGEKHLDVCLLHKCKCDGLTPVARLPLSLVGLVVYEGLSCSRRTRYSGRVEEKRSSGRRGSSIFNSVFFCMRGQEAGFMLHLLALC